MNIDTLLIAYSLLLTKPTPRQIAPALKEKMVLKGTMMIGYQPLGDRVNFFRVVVSNLELTNADMDFITDEIERCGANM